MLKKLLSYIVAFFGLVALWASTSRDAMQYLAEKRDNNSGGEGTRWRTETLSAWLTSTV